MASAKSFDISKQLVWRAYQPRQDHYKLELLSEEAIRSMSNHLL